MAQRVFHAPNFTPTAQADGGALTNATYMGLRGGSSTQVLRVSEIAGMGLAGASGPMIMQMARSSTVATTPTALASPNSDGGKNPSITTLVSGQTPISFVAAATGPTRSNATTDAKLELNFNAFGGIYRWQVPRGEEWMSVGNGNTSGESIYSQFTGGTSNAISGHIVYEPD